MQNKRNDEMLRQQIHQAADDYLSHVGIMPLSKAQIMRYIDGKEGKAIQKRVPAFAVAFVMILLLGGVALAAGLGIFGSFMQDPQSELSTQRLEKLDAVADPIGVSVTVASPGQAEDTQQATGDVQRTLSHMAGQNFTLTIDQAYSDGTKVYFSYVLTTDRAPQMRFGVGKPAGIDEWDLFDKGTRFAERYSLYDFEETQQAAKWLDDHEASYVICEHFSLGDGADLNGEPLNVYDSGFRFTDEQTVMGYQEVLLPDGYEASDALKLTMSIGYGASLYYQDETGVYWKWLSPKENRGFIHVDVTLPVSGTVQPISGTVTTQNYTAEAKLVISDVDIYGTVTISGLAVDQAGGEPYDWARYAVLSYELVAGDETLRDLNGAISDIVDGVYTLGLRFDLPKDASKLILKPEGRNTLDDGSDCIELSPSV